MPDQTTPETKTESIEEPIINFPSLSNGPSVFYDDAKHELWFGLPFDKVNLPHFVGAAFDRAKWDAYVHLASYFQEIQKREQFKRSTIGGHVNGVMRDLFEKGKKLVGLNGSA